MTKKLDVAIICGGPSPERGISLNSARSLSDHLEEDLFNIVPFYVDQEKNFYKISRAQLYSNTPSDFDFKLSKTSERLDHLTFVHALQQTDIVFPAMHGAFGEDGGIQSLLEEHNIPFVGSGSTCCQTMFHKKNAALLLEAHGYETLPSLLIEKGDPEHAQKLEAFWQEQSLTRAVVKPVGGGSSIGVFSVETLDQAHEKLALLFDMNIGESALIEPFCEGREFTIIVLENHKNHPVALIPTEISVSYDNNDIFDYRRKYLPSNNTFWHCPPRFENSVIETIRTRAQELFSLFSMQDFARLDGWVLNDGRILFSDFNPISGMEQNSFIFQQASRIGFTHTQLLSYIVKGACKKHNIEARTLPHPLQKEKGKVHVLFGGKTAERQVSVMSGTNIWLKLKKSHAYDSTPFLLDQNGDVWKLPYTFALNHTVEEIYENCVNAQSIVKNIHGYEDQIKSALTVDLRPVSAPQKMSLEEFIETSKADNAFVFIGLHGGEGEDGTLQKRLDEAGLLYNGSDPDSAQICMDKYVTGEMINKNLKARNITACQKIKIDPESFKNYSNTGYDAFWTKICAESGGQDFVIKPMRDGCSAGIIRLQSSKDLQTYMSFMHAGALFIPPHSFAGQASIVEMSVGDGSMDYMLESYIETDDFSFSDNELHHHLRTGWVEFTVGIIEQNGVYHSFNPSITVAENAILSVEEKFQGGTGVNITPPPETLITTESLKYFKVRMEDIANVLKIKNYTRIDVFYNVKSEDLIVIEANALPGMTPSTVIYHQALEEEPSMYPLEFIEKLIDLKTGKVNICSLSQTPVEKCRNVA